MCEGYRNLEVSNNYADEASNKREYVLKAYLTQLHPTMRLLSVNGALHYEALLDTFVHKYFGQSSKECYNQRASSLKPRPISYLNGTYLIIVIVECHFILLK